MRLRGSQLVIDQHGSGLVRRHAGLVQAEVCGGRGSAGGKENEVRLDHIPIRQLQQAPLAVGDDPRRRDVRIEADTLGQQRFRRSLPNVHIEAPQRQRLAIDQIDLCTECREDAGELHRDIAAAKDRDALGHGGQVEGVVGNDALIGARNVQPRGVAAGGDDDALGRHALAADIQGMWIDEHRSSIEDGCAGVVQQAAIDAVQPGDLPVLGGKQLGPVVRALLDGPAEAGGVIGKTAILAGLHQQLLRHAADIDAGAAPETLLRDRHAGAVAGGNAGTANTGRAAADDEEIVVHEVLTFA